MENLHHDPRLAPGQDRGLSYASHYPVLGSGGAGDENRMIEQLHRLEVVIGELCRRLDDLFGPNHGSIQ